MVRDAVDVSVMGSMWPNQDQRYIMGSDWLKAMRTPAPSAVPKIGSVALSGSPASASAANELTA